LEGKNVAMDPSKFREWLEINRHIFQLGRVYVKVHFEVYVLTLARINQILSEPQTKPPGPLPAQTAHHQ
jgi:hypothetical protein